MRKFLTTLIGLLVVSAVFCLLDPALAKDKKKEKQACDAEIAKICPSVKGKEKKQCIKTNMSKFSDPCQKKFQKKKDKKK